MKKQAIVLLSGGQDSTTSLFWALRNLGPVIAVGFNYGQRHSIELVQAQKIADQAGVPYHVFNLDGLLSGSSLTDHAKDINSPHDIAPELPSSFTAGRNMLFLTIAASLGYNQGISDLVTGVCQTDYSGYPDCRQEFIKAQENALFFAMEKHFNIHTPLMHLTKAQTWKMAYDLNGQYDIDGKPQHVDVLEIVRTMTMTDYRGNVKMNDWGMGAIDNPATELRAKGYRQAIDAGYIPDVNGAIVKPA
jgi:7-cyano-7-deazaguanine synthase